MPTLNWIGKEKIINHHNDVKFRLLKKKYHYGKASGNNILIHGDNLEGLKSLLPYYENSIECIYIDPPYNTGKKEGQWVYSDNLDDPRFKKWLNKVVGAEGDDLSRHDKWLCMMYPRLRIMQKLLKENGAIFISIDDNELFNCKLMCDEIFGTLNFGGLLSVEINPKGRKNSDFISVSNDYCLIYLKDKPKSKFIENIPKDKKDLSLDENGRLVHNSGKRVLVGENSFNSIVDDFESDKHYSVYYNKENKNIVLCKEKKLDDSNAELISKNYHRYISYKDNDFVENTYSKDKFVELFEEGALDFKENKIYEKNFSDKIRIKSIVSNKEYETYENGKVVKFKIDVKTTSAGTELKQMFKTSKPPFNNPKNKFFIELLVSLFENKNLTVLDAFAGSGTTGHAVLDLNKKDGGKRKFIEIEMMDYAEDITSKRTKLAIDGYDEVPPLGSGFDFYELGEPILDDDGNLNSAVSDDEIKNFIFYTETHMFYTKSEDINYLGSDGNAAYYIFYDKKSTTCLDFNMLKKIKSKAESYIVYADTCTLSEKYMKNHHIIFKKIPRDIQKI